jgi:hypothetical protein
VFRFSRLKNEWTKEKRKIDLKVNNNKKKKKKTRTKSYELQIKLKEQLVLLDFFFFDSLNDDLTVYFFFTIVTHLTLLKRKKNIHTLSKKEIRNFRFFSRGRKNNHLS